MKKRILLSVCILAVLAAAIVCLPFARKIDTTVTATEYKFNDPSYAVEHTVVIQGYDTRNLLGYGEFTGTFTVSGFESWQANCRTSFGFFRKGPSVNTSYLMPSGELRTGSLFYLRASRDWSDFAGLIMEVTDSAGHSISLFDPDNFGCFLVSGPADREAAMARAAELYQRDPYYRGIFTLQGEKPQDA